MDTKTLERIIPDKEFSDKLILIAFIEWVDGPQFAQDDGTESLRLRVLAEQHRPGIQVRMEDALRLALGIFS